MFSVVIFCKIFARKTFKIDFSFAFIYFRMVLENNDNTEEIKRQLAVRLLVPAINIHIIFNKNELG